MIYIAMIMALVLFTATLDLHYTMAMLCRVGGVCALESSSYIRNAQCILSQGTVAYPIHKGI